MALTSVPPSCQRLAYRIISPASSVVSSLRHDSALSIGQVICGGASGTKWPVHMRCSGCAPSPDTGLSVLADHPASSQASPYPCILPVKRKVSEQVLFYKGFVSRSRDYLSHL